MRFIASSNLFSGSFQSQRKVLKNTYRQSTLLRTCQA